MTRKIGNRSVVLGNVDHDDIGDDCVVMGATDAYGNARYDMEGAFGAHAKAGPGSLAVGYGAGSGERISSDRPAAYKITTRIYTFGFGAKKAGK